MHFLDKHHFLSFPTCWTEPRLILYCQLMHNPFAARLIKKPQAQIKRTVLFPRAEDCRGTFFLLLFPRNKTPKLSGVVVLFRPQFYLAKHKLSNGGARCAPPECPRVHTQRGFPRRQMNLSGARRPKRRRRGGGGVATVKDVLLFKRSSWLI